MCTVILGVDVLEPASVILAANRDELPSRASASPALLNRDPRVAGGRDLVAGGTWLAVRERRAALALLNRRPLTTPSPETVALRRSRGLLTLDLACTPASSGPATFADVCERAARAAFAAASYGPCSLLFASPERSWIASHDGRSPLRVETPGPGWHVVTHADLDDRAEPRTAWLLGQLGGWRPGSPDQAIARLRDLLGTHPDARSGTPAVCIHDESPMSTVSSALVRLSRDHGRYLHAEGRPCTSPFVDHSHLLAEPAAAGERA